MTKRQIELGRAIFAGYHNDSASFVRCLVERKTASYEALHAAWRQGFRAKQNGVPCNCFDCKRAARAVPA